MPVHYINHNNPAAHALLTTFLIQHGIASQVSATGIADMIIRDHIVTFNNTTFVHLGTL